MREDEITPGMVASVPLAGGCLGLLMVVYLYTKVASAPRGTGEQVVIADQISIGATSFLKTEYTYLVPFVIVVGAFIIGVLEGQESTPRDAGSNYFFTRKGGWQTFLCFLFGAILSAACGWGGMKIATMANVRTMEAAKGGLNPALKVAFAGGAVMGFTVVSCGILGVTIFFLIFSLAIGDSADEWHLTIANMQSAIRYLSGFGFGASAIALFARVAGGIYTKAADVGADLVGKVQEDIPEDDPRNPATIADNVGDNVGDVAGMGADLFESFVGSIIAAATLADNARELALSFWIGGFGILAAFIGFFTVSTKDDATQKDLLHSIHRGIYVASFIVIGLSAAAVSILFEGADSETYISFSDYSRYCLANPRDQCCGDALSRADGDSYDAFIASGCSVRQENKGWRYFACIIIGLVAGVLIGEATEYFTSYAYTPTTSISKAGSSGGAATVIIQGLGMGMFSTVPPVVIIVAAIIACYELGEVYGIAVAAIGMLSTLGVTLATDAYGPVADNAGGIAEMTPDCPEEVRDRTDRLDALGNTTAATGKGFAIGSAVLTALALMAAFSQNVVIDLVLDLKNPLVLAGVILGAMLPFLFAALTMLSVRKAAVEIIIEVQDQFATIPGLLAGEPGVKPDTQRCVDRCTKASVQEMVLPGAIAVLIPPSWGLLVGANALGGLLIGAIASGFLLGVMMSNTGGAWDNAKKYIENEKAYGGKKSETHKACVVGDTVGDPFKDTSGPSLNILIKLMSVFSLTLAPIFRGDWRTWWEGLVMMGVSLLIIFIAFYYIVVKGEQAEPERREMPSEKKATSV